MTDKLTIDQQIDELKNDVMFRANPTAIFRYADKVNREKFGWPHVEVHCRGVAHFIYLGATLSAVQREQRDRLRQAAMETFFFNGYDQLIKHLQDHDFLLGWPGVKFPKSVLQIANVIGMDKTLYLLGKLPQCGKRSWRVVLYVPKPSGINPNSPLVQIIGWIDACKMAEAFGGEILQPSNCKFVYREFRNQQILEMRAKGHSPEVISCAFEISKKQVKNILAKEITPEEINTENPLSALNSAA